MKKILVLMAVFSVAQFQQKAHGQTDVRENSINFKVGLEGLSNSSIEYFFQVLDSNNVQEKADKFANDPGALQEVSGLDTTNLRKNLGANGVPYFIITKVAYTTDKDISFFNNDVLNISYWKTTRPELGITTVQGQPSENKISFVSKGNSFAVPPSILNLEKFGAAEELSTTNTGVKTLLSKDQEFGQPDLILWEHYTNFQKHGIDSNTFTKYYSIPGGRTLAIAYTLVYNKEVMPNFMKYLGFGAGAEGMRRIAVSTVHSVLGQIEKY